MVSELYCILLNSILHAVYRSFAAKISNIPDNTRKVEEFGHKIRGISENEDRKRFNHYNKIEKYLLKRIT